MTFRMLATAFPRRFWTIAGLTTFFWVCLAMAPLPSAAADSKAEPADWPRFRGPATACLPSTR
jgi:hypothetical protein